MQVAYAHHGEEGVAVLIVHEPVRGLEGVEAVDFGHVVVELVAVHQAVGVGRRPVLVRHELGGESVADEIVFDADVEVAAVAEHVERPVPLVGGEEVEHEEFRFGEELLAGRDLQYQGVQHPRSHRLGNYPARQGVRLVHGHGDLAGGDVVVLAPGAHLHLHLGMAEELHHVCNAHHLAALVVDGDVLVGAVEVLRLAYAERQGLALVAGPFHLVDVPVGAEQGGVGDAHVRTHVFHFLGVPEREGVVVAVGDEHALGTYGLEVVRTEFGGACCICL